MIVIMIVVNVFLLWFGLKTSIRIGFKHGSFRVSRLMFWGSKVKMTVLGITDRNYSAYPLVSRVDIGRLWRYLGLALLRGFRFSVQGASNARTGNLTDIKKRFMF